MLRIVLEDCLVVLVARDEVMVLFAFLARVSGYCTALLGVSRSTEREPRNGALLCSLPGSRCCEFRVRVGCWMGGKFLGFVDDVEWGVWEPVAPV